MKKKRPTSTSTSTEDDLFRRLLKIQAPMAPDQPVSKYPIGTQREVGYADGTIRCEVWDGQRWVPNESDHTPSAGPEGEGNGA